MILREHSYVLKTTYKRQRSCLFEISTLILVNNSYGQFGDNCMALY